MRVFILIYLCFQGLAVSSREPCVYQVKTRIVQTGGSVIIPCSYTDPKIEEEHIEVRWLEGDAPTCELTSSVISPPTKTKYSARLNTWKDLNRNRTHYLRITGLKPKDGPTFCCQIVIKKHPKKDYKPLHGTRLLFSAKESVTQLDELIAVEGEVIDIPCHYSKSGIQGVTWYHIQNDDQLCSTPETKMYAWEKAGQHGRYSLVNDLQDASLRIRNINTEDQGGYCCQVTSGNGKESSSKQVTMLLIADQETLQMPSSETTVQIGEAVNVSCSYSVPEQHRESDIVWVNVYWRAGNVAGPYAYHPYQEMVYSSFMNRTTITGIADLHIKNVRTEDNTTFHCFVVLKVCKGENEYDNEIVYGGETRLYVEESPQNNEACASTEGAHSTIGGSTTHGTGPTPGYMAQRGLPQDIIIIIVTSVIVLVILILILIILKAKGALCMKKRTISAEQMKPIPAPDQGDRSDNEMGYCDIIAKKPDEAPMDGTDETEGKETEDGEDGKLLYAKLDQTKLNDRRQAQRLKPSEEVVYADVVNTAAS